MEENSVMSRRISLSQSLNLSRLTATLPFLFRAFFLLISIFFFLVPVFLSPPHWKLIVFYHHKDTCFLIDFRGPEEGEKHGHWGLWKKRPPTLHSDSRRWQRWVGGGRPPGTQTTGLGDNKVNYKSRYAEWEEKKRKEIQCDAVQRARRPRPSIRFSVSIYIYSLNAT